jgi:hypothetical protein
VTTESTDWVNTKAIMRHLGIRSRSTLALYKRMGLPYSRVPGSNKDRYSPARADEWLKTFERSAGVRKGRPKVAHDHRHPADPPPTGAETHRSSRRNPPGAGTA